MASPRQTVVMRRMNPRVSSLYPTVNQGPNHPSHRWVTAVGALASWFHPFIDRAVPSSLRLSSILGSWLEIPL
jgi:hypothetical protein